MSKLVLLAASWSWFAAFARAADDYSRVGYSPQPPASGPQIKTPHGYMVAYKLKIPGTDVEFEMAPIPGGKCRIGSPDSEPARKPEEGPQFEVEVRPRWVGKYEVTWAEYQRFMALDSVFAELVELRTALAGGTSKDAQRQKSLVTDLLKDDRFTALRNRLSKPGDKTDAITAPTKLYDPSTTYQSGNDARQPAVTMTQYAAKHYTKWLSRITGHAYRLPTEAEWEHACRAGTTTAYSFGNDIGQLGKYAWYTENADERTHKVGEKLPNPWGLYDMHGNAAEWVLDEFKTDAYRAFASKTVPAAEAVVWPKVQWPRVVRGGCWDDAPQQLRSAARRGSDDDTWKTEDPNRPKSPWWYTEDLATGVGFRLVRTVEPLSAADRQRCWEADVESIREDVRIRLKNGRGLEDTIDPDLPAVIQQLEAFRQRREAAEKRK